MKLHEAPIGQDLERDSAKYGTRLCKAVVVARDERGTHYRKAGGSRDPHDYITLRPDEDDGGGWQLASGTPASD